MIFKRAIRRMLDKIERSRLDNLLDEESSASLIQRLLECLSTEDTDIGAIYRDKTTKLYCLNKNIIETNVLLTSIVRTLQHGGNAKNFLIRLDTITVSACDYFINEKSHYVDVKSALLTFKESLYEISRYYQDDGIVQDTNAITNKREIRLQISNITLAVKSLVRYINERKEQR